MWLARLAAMAVAGIMRSDGKSQAAHLASQPTYHIKLKEAQSSHRTLTKQSGNLHRNPNNKILIGPISLIRKPGTPVTLAGRQWRPFKA
jgi:hypothetical protein